MARIVIFDGLCKLCSRSVRFILRHDRRGVFKFLPAQSAPGRALLIQCGMNPEQLETFVLVGDGRVYVRSNAALAIAAELDWPWRALRFLRVVPRPLRDSLYSSVARNRYRWFGKRDRCLIPTDDMTSRFVEHDRRGG